MVLLLISRKLGDKRLVSQKLKTHFVRYNAQLAERKLLLCNPLARGESRKRDSYLYFVFHSMHAAIDLRCDTNFFFEGFDEIVIVVVATFLGGLLNRHAGLEHL